MVSMLVTGSGWHEPPLPRCPRRAPNRFPFPSAPGASATSLSPRLRMHGCSATLTRALLAVYTPIEKTRVRPHSNPKGRVSRCLRGYALPALHQDRREMMSIFNRPLIQYAVDEASGAGCDTQVFGTNRYKHSVVDSFDKTCELEQKLERGRKQKQLTLIQQILPQHVRAVSVGHSRKFFAPALPEVLTVHSAEAVAACLLISGFEVASGA